MAKRNRIVAIRLSEEEFAQLKDQAEQCALKLEPMLRNMIAGLELHSRPCEHHPALLKSLSDISNDIGQILHSLQLNEQFSEHECIVLNERLNDCWAHISSKY